MSDSWRSGAGVTAVAQPAWRALLLAVALLATTAPLTAPAAGGARFGLGTPASAAAIRAQDIAIGPRGEELPAGSGRAVEGAEVYATHCAMCHGATGTEGPDPVLVGGQGSLASEQPRVTIGSFWPYSTTVFDYVSRAMPFTAPGSLSADEVYALTAFLLNANGIIDADARVDGRSLPAIRMPNREGFMPDPRPDLP